MADEMFLQRMVMALVRKAGGHVELTEDEIWEDGNFKMSFDPPLGKDQARRVPVEEQLIILDVADYEDDDEEEDELDDYEDVEDPNEE